MKVKMFAVHDTKAAAYLQPWFQTTDALAIRNFADCINDKNHNFGRHPEDYNLFLIGEFNDQDAMLETHAPKSLGNGIEFIKLEIGAHEENWDEEHQIDLWEKERGITDENRNEWHRKNGDNK